MKVLSDIKELKEYFNDEDLLVEFGGTSTFKYKYPFDDEYKKLLGINTVDKEEKTEEKTKGSKGIEENKLDEVKKDEIVEVDEKQYKDIKQEEINK